MSTSSSTSSTSIEKSQTPSHRFRGKLFHAQPGPVADAAARPYSPAVKGFAAEALAIARYHIMLVAMSATVVFGWIATGSRPWALTLVVAVDWFLINLM